MAAGSDTTSTGRPIIYVLTWMTENRDLRPERAVRSATRRRALDRVLGPDAAMLTVSQDQTGRARVVGPGAERFDICSSSTAGCMAVAVSINCRVGIDIEKLRPELVDTMLAREALAAQELSEFNGAADPVEYFFRAWTMKEALLKASGLGLRCHPRTVRLAPSPTLPGWLISTISGNGDWIARAIQGPPGTALTIATTASPVPPRIVEIGTLQKDEPSTDASGPAPNPSFAE